MRHPMFEAFGAFQLASEDQGIQTGFVDDGHLLLP